VTQRRPAGLSLPANRVLIEIPHRIEITTTSRENEFPHRRYSGGRRQKHLPRFGTTDNAAYRFAHYPNFN